mmetsp:Transcript_10447/g.14789  ORF Transcript_10447/g.14789 Transcript_10447/m.14789 type:complete len:114 (+) Transcript_10447:89-430(+)
MNRNMTHQYSSEMLASSIMLMSICEQSEIHPGYKPTTLTPSNSEGSLPGWGNAMTRRSYKTNLSSLANDDTNYQPQQLEQKNEHGFMENYGTPQQPKRTETTPSTTKTASWFR